MEEAQRNLENVWTYYFLDQLLLTSVVTDLAFNEMSFLKVQEVAELHETDHAVNNEGNDEDENSEEFNRGEGFASDSTYEKAQVLETYRHSPLSNRTSNPSPLPESSVCQPGDKDKQAASEEVQPHHSNDHLLGERHTHLDRPPSDKEIETSVPQCDMPDIQEEVPIGTVSTRVIPQISVSTTQTTAATEPGGATGLPNEDPRIQQTNSEDQQTHNAEHISDKAPTMISPAHISAYKDQGVMVTPLLHQKQIYSENRWRDDLPREHQNMVYNIEPSKERLFHLHPQFGAKAEPRPEYSPMSLPSAHYEPPRWHDTFCSNKKENVQIGPYQRLRAFSAFNFPLEGTGIIRDRSHIGSTNVRSTSQLGDYREKASYEVTAGFKEKQLVGKERGDYSTGYGHQGVGTIDVDVIPLNRSHISPPSVSKRRPSLDGIDQAREILENYENEQFHAYGSNDETMIEFIDRVEAEALIEWNEAHFMEHTTDDNRGYDCDVNGGLNGTVEIGEDHEMTSFWWSNNPFV
ncbi:hypothetical protein BGZ63DRAFT_125005 [Mariannaea sp. PMI_226]|nr:hypothetical protein BGZ63DRAFT_125005 [Mariannaea sp. PMI_226]